MVIGSRRARAALGAALVFVVALALYVRTLLPDVGTWDTAEFQAIGPVLGIAHPTGYPTYTLLAWLASVVLQPFGNEAYRADLLSALLVAGAAALAVVATVQLTRRAWLGIAAGLLFAVTPVAWQVATRADAHALHVFLAATMLVLLLGWCRRVRSDPSSIGAHGPATVGPATVGPLPDATGTRPEATAPVRGRADAWLVAAAAVFGMSLGNHALTLLLAPGIAAFVLLVEPRILAQWRLVVACLAVSLGVAALAYAYLPIRSAMDPPLDYASPDTWRGFWYVVLGQQFQGSIRPLPSVAAMVAGAWDELVRDLGPLVILVPTGVILGAGRYPRTLVLTGLWFLATWVFALGYANAIIERYYLVPLLAACVWVALAADVAWDAVRGLLAWLPGRLPRAVPAIAAVLGAALLLVAVSPVPERVAGLDQSGPSAGRAWLEATFSALARDAVIVSWWSYSTPLWYGRWVEGRRPDITVIDDRDVLDLGYGDAAGAIDRFLGERPVYVTRLDRDLPALAQRYELERVASIPSPGDVYRVMARRAQGPPGPADAPARDVGDRA